jgi:hypothetical protein
MSVVTIIKKIGERIISIVEAPFKYAAQTEKVLADGIKDAPQLKSAIVGLVHEFEQLGPDVLQCIAEKGFDIPEDLKACADVKALFQYFTQTFMPVVEATVADFKHDVATSAPAAPVVEAPGLHTTIPA